MGNACFGRTQRPPCVPNLSATTTSIPVLAGIASTVIFASSALPMLVKARRTMDLTSYSPGHLVLANVGNAVHSIYVFAMPVGPIWALHGFLHRVLGADAALVLRPAPEHARSESVRE